MVRNVLLGVALALAAAGPASAVTVTFDGVDRSTESTALTYSESGYDFSNSQGTGDALLFWGSDPSNADPVGNTLSNNYGGTTTTVVRSDAATFTLGSVDFGDVYNSGTGGDVNVFFTTASGTTTQTISLDTLVGLQTFTFNQTGLLSFGYLPLTTQGPWIQADNFVFETVAGVPEPMSWALLTVGFGLAGTALRRRRGAVAA